MRIDTALDKKISTVLIEENRKRNEEHISSGKLSASMLGKPLQWQVLKNIGVPSAPIDEYTLRKFQRGNHVEDWIVKHMDSYVKEKQKEIEYRGVVGFVDVVVDTSEWDFKLGIIPMEVKSVSNAKYKRLTTRKNPDRGHLLQAALYALALKTPYFGLIYVASDDYRIYTSIHDTEDFRGVIDGVIDAYDAQMVKREIPAFVLPTSEDKWMENKKYCAYPHFLNLDSKAAIVLAKEVAGNKFKW